MGLDVAARGDLYDLQQQIVRQEPLQEWGRTEIAPADQSREERMKRAEAEARVEALRDSLNMMISS